VLLDHADAFDRDLMLGAVDLEDLPFGATMVPGDNLHEVTGMNMGFVELKCGHCL
jgi:hypothetical protein